MEQFSKSWNVNIIIMFDVPRNTHCWIVEELSGGKLFKHMIYSRFLKYLQTVQQNRRSFLRNMYNIVVNYVKTNVRKIFLEYNLDPRFAVKHQLMQWRIYQPSDTWSVPLLVSLLELKQKKWVVNFEMEEEVDTLEDEELDFMIEAVCTG